MTDVAVLELQAKTDGLKKAEAALDGVTNAAMRTEDAAKDAGVAVNSAGGAMGKAGGNTRMFAQQLSQVAQQGAATGQWMQAFTIQAADIGMAFGTIGTILGTVATVALPALIASLSGGASGTAAFDKALTDLEDTIDSTSGLVKIANGDFDALIEKFGTLTPAVAALVQAQGDISLRNLADAAKALTGELVALYDGNAWLNISRVEELDRALGLSGKSANEFGRALIALRDAGNLDDQLAIVTRMRERFVEIIGPVAKMGENQFAFYTALADSEAKLRETKLRAEQMAGAGDDIIKSFGPIDGILEAAKLAADATAAAVASIGASAFGSVAGINSMASALWDAATAAAYAANNREMQTQRGSLNANMRGRAGGKGQGVTDNYSFDMAAYTKGLHTGGGGGGGGGGTDSYASDLDALVKSLETERETTDAWYAESMKLLEDRRAMEILGAQGHADALLAIEQELQSRRADLQSQQISDTAGLFGALGDIAQSGGKKMVRVVAGFEAIQGTLNAYGAAIKALNTPGITLAGRFAAYASVLAAGLSGVAKIRSAGGGGGGGSYSGGSSAVGSASSTPAVAPDRQIRVNIQGDGLFAEALRGSIRQIAEALGNERDIGGFVVT